MEKIQENQLPLSSFLGRLLSICLPKKHGKIIRKNISIVFGDKLSLNQKKNLELAFYAHIVKSIKEFFLFKCLSKRKLTNKFIVEGKENLQKAINQNKGVFLLAGHFGNFEVSAAWLPIIVDEFDKDVYVIRKSIKKNRVEKSLFKTFSRFGAKIILAKGALKRVCKAIEKKQIVTFPIDQHKSLADKTGIAVDFFKCKTGTYSTLANMVYHKSTPVVPMYLYRDSNNHHVIKFYPAVEHTHFSNKCEFVSENTRIYNSIIENMVLCKPEQWFGWLHKRWKYLKEHYND